MDRLDILNRDEFVDELVRILESISDNKSSISFAIDGDWGCGKSFVLDMLEEKLSSIQLEESSNDKYFVLRYNSWKFDYYEEPLIAVVATLISAIEQKTKLFPEGEKKQRMLGMLKVVGASLLSFGNAAIKEKTGVDLQNVYETLATGNSLGIEAYEKKHDYDIYFGFNKVLSELVKVMQDIASDYTIVILVDELDRCIPEYAVKVLERLHHLTEGNSNIITITATDKKQLESSIKQIFGFDNPKKYLKKFLAFEVKLDYGNTSNKIIDKYSSYIDMFDKDIFTFDNSVEECLQAIFQEIDIRTQEQIVQKALMAHKLLYTEKKDYSFMCMELLLAVMMNVYEYESNFFKQPINVLGFDNVFTYTKENDLKKEKIQPHFAAFFKEKFEEISFKRSRIFSDTPENYVLPAEPDLYAAIFYTWYWMHKNSKALVKYIKNGVYEGISNNYTELKKFVDFIDLIG